jgi:hypothetical protein
MDCHGRDARTRIAAERRGIAAFGVQGWRANKCVGAEETRDGRMTELLRAP